MTRSTLTALVGALTLAGLTGCFGSKGGSDDDSGSPADGTDGTDGTGGDGTDGTDGTTPDGLTTLSDPCAGIGPITAMFAPSSSETWVGCGNGAGLWLSADAGDSFDRGHPSEDLYVFDIKKDASGRVLACGHDYDGANDGVLLWRQDGSDWQSLLSYGNNNTSSDLVYLSNCGQVAQHPDGGLLVISNTSGDLTVSNDGGATWSKEDRYWEEVNLDGGPQAYQMMQVVSTADGVYGSGYNIAQPPTFFAPSSNPDARWYNLAATVVDSGVDGEGWSLATTDGGDTWFLGGRDQSASSRASGFLYTSTDGGASWSSLTLGEEIDILRDIAFDDAGVNGIAVGDRYPPNSLGGFALLTTDGGATWAELDEDLPADLQRAAVIDGEYLIGGNGYLARGTF